MNKKIWIIDAIVFFGFLLAMKPQITGYNLHEWLGLAVGAVALVHLLQHWRWVMSVSKMMERIKANIRTKYILDVMMATGFIVIIITGLIISFLLNLQLKHYDTWRTLHFAASYATFLMLSVKVVLHWRLIMCTLGKAFSRTAKIDEPCELSAEQLARRHLLRDAGFATLGVVIAAGGLSSLFKSSGTASASVDSQASTQEASTLAAQASPTALPSQPPANTPTGSLQVLPSATPLPTATATAVPLTGKVMCSRGCAYPGKWKKYQDNNGNGLCDLGEPIW